MKKYDGEIRRFYKKRNRGNRNEKQNGRGMRIGQYE